MLKPSLCNYSDAYILVKGTVTVLNTAAVNNANREVTFKTYSPFTDYISEHNNALVDNAKNIDVIMAIYTVMEYSDNYLKTFIRLWQYYSDKKALNNAGNNMDFLIDGNSSISFKFQKI